MRNENIATKELLAAIEYIDNESDKLITDILSKANLWANGYGREY